MRRLGLMSSQRGVSISTKMISTSLLLIGLITGLLGTSSVYYGRRAFDQAAQKLSESYDSAIGARAQTLTAAMSESARAALAGPACRRHRLHAGPRIGGRRGRADRAASRLTARLTLRLITRRTFAPPGVIQRLRIQSAVPKNDSASRSASVSSICCSCRAWIMQAIHWSRSLMPMA